MKLFVVLVFIVAGASVEGRPKGFFEIPFVGNITGFSKELLNTTASAAKTLNGAAKSVSNNIAAVIDASKLTVRSNLDMMVDKAMQAKQIQPQFSGSTAEFGSLKSTGAAYPGLNISTSNIASSTETMESNIPQSTAEWMKTFNKILTENGASAIKTSIQSQVAEPLAVVSLLDLVSNTVNDVVQSGNVDRSAIIDVTSKRISDKIAATLGITSGENDGGMIEDLKRKLLKSLKGAAENAIGGDFETFLNKIVTVIVNVICDFLAALTPPNQSNFTSTSSSSSSNGGSFSLTM